MVKKNCKTCGNLASMHPKGWACRRLSNGNYIHEVDPEIDYCSKHTNGIQPLVCDACGQSGLIDYICSWKDDFADMKILCPSCYSKTNTCYMCRSAQTCDFETNPIPIPPIVTKTIRQGPMVMQTQIRNPDRVAETCAKNCSCYDPEKGCLRELGWCSNYKED